MNVLRDQVDVWLERCNQNIAKMEQDGYTLDDFRNQYGILHTVVGGISGRIHFSGVPFIWPERE